MTYQVYFNWSSKSMELSGKYWAKMVRALNLYIVMFGSFLIEAKICFNASSDLPSLHKLKDRMNIDLEQPGLYSKLFATSWVLSSYWRKIYCRIAMLLQYLYSLCLRAQAVVYFPNDYLQSPISYKVIPKLEKRWAEYSLSSFFTSQNRSIIKEQVFRSLFLAYMFTTYCHLKSLVCPLLFIMLPASAKLRKTYFVIWSWSFFKEEKQQGFNMQAFSYTIFDASIWPFCFKHMLQKQRALAFLCSIYRDFFSNFQLTVPSLSEVARRF